MMTETLIFLVGIAIGLCIKLKVNIKIQGGKEIIKCKEKEIDYLKGVIKCYQEQKKESLTAKAALKKFLNKYRKNPVEVDMSIFDQDRHKKI